MDPMPLGKSAVRPRMKTRVVIAGIAGIGFVAAYFHMADLGPGGSTATDREAVTAGKTDRRVSDRIRYGSSASRPADEGAEWDRESLWNRFRGKYGNGLAAVFDREGRIAEIRLKGKDTLPSDGGFDPSSPRHAIRRARAVIEDLGPLMGIRKDFPLDRPVARGDEKRAQVFFQQTAGGVRIAPTGKVTLEFGPGGELVSLYSDYVPDLVITNDFSVDPGRARKAAESALEDSARSVRTVGGSRVVWVPSPGSSRGRVEGRRAFEFLVAGHQVIVDGATGEVIMRRDRRHFRAAR